MNRFKKGDRVKRVSILVYHRGMRVGDEDVVVEIDEGGALTLQEYGKGHNPENFELVTPAYPNPPHKHAELIKAWADGAEIEFHIPDTGWCQCGNVPIWDEHVTYRIKPSNPNAEKIAEIETTISQLQQQVKELKNAD